MKKRRSVLVFVSAILLLVLAGANLLNSNYASGTGQLLVSFGALLNLAVVLANNGRMPVKLGTGDFIWACDKHRHVEMNESSRFKQLGDVINLGLVTASLGDVLIISGFVLMFGSILFKLVKAFT